MKKILMLVLAVLSLQGAAFAAGAANIHIRISGAARDNTYFLCLPNVGCLSILAGNEGKVYPVFHPVKISEIFVTNVDAHFRLSAQGLPSSCNVTVQPNQTVTISGSIVAIPNGNVRIAGLHCSLN